MIEPVANRDFWETVAKVLLRCWLLGFLLLLLFAGVFLLGSDVIYRLHGEMFGLSKHDLDVIFYCGIA